MEKFIRDIETYAASVGRSPQAVLRSAVSASWGTLDSWRAGKSSPTMALADRVRDYIAANPPPATAAPPEQDVA